MRSKLPVKSWLLGAVLSAAAAPAFAFTSVTTAGSLGNAAGPAAGAVNLSVNGIGGTQNNVGDSDGLNLLVGSETGSEVNVSLTGETPSTARVGRDDAGEPIVQRETPNEVTTRANEAPGVAQVVITNPAPNPVSPRLADEPPDESGGRDAAAKKEVTVIKGKLEEGGGKVSVGKLDKLVENADTVAHSPDATTQIAGSMAESGADARKLNENMAKGVLSGRDTLPWYAALASNAARPGASAADKKAAADARPGEIREITPYLLSAGNRTNPALDALTSQSSPAKREESRRQVADAIGTLSMANAALSTGGKDFILGFRNTREDPHGLKDRLAEAIDPVNGTAASAEAARFELRETGDGRFRVEYAPRPATAVGAAVAAVRAGIESISSVLGNLSLPFSGLFYSPQDSEDAAASAMAARGTGATMENLGPLEWFTATMRSLWPRLQRWLSAHLRGFALLMQRLGLLSEGGPGPGRIFMAAPTSASLPTRSIRLTIAPI